MARPKTVADEILRQSITLPAEVAMRVRALAKRRNVHVGQVLRELVSLGVERQERLDRIADALDDPTPKVAV